MKLFVYYKFLPADYDNLLGAIRALQDKVRLEFPSVDCALLRRPEPNDKGEQTWMECYDMDAANLDVFRPFLEALVQEQPIPQARFYEVFVSVES